MKIINRFIKKQIKKHLKQCSQSKLNEYLDEYLNLNVVWENFDDSWIKYYFINKDMIDDKINNLKSNLDNASQNIVEMVAERAFLMCPTAKYSEFFYLNKSNIWTESEKNFQKQNFSPDFKLFYGKDLKEESVYRFDCGLKLLDKEVLSKLEGMDFIDAGAYIGDSAFNFIKYTPNKIYCFEPSKSNFNNLTKNIEKYNFVQKIIPIEKGLGSFKQIMQSDLGEGSNYKIIQNESAHENNNIEIIDIDSYVRENNLNLGLIKMDIEGAEFDAVSGAIETIKQHKPVLLISIYHNPNDFFEIKPLIEKLDLGYKFKVKKLNNSTLFTETMLIAY